MADLLRDLVYEGVGRSRRGGGGAMGEYSIVPLLVDSLLRLLNRSLLRRRRRYEPPCGREVGPRRWRRVWW